LKPLHNEGKASKGYKTSESLAKMENFFEKGLLSIKKINSYPIKTKHHIGLYSIFIIRILPSSQLQTLLLKT
jgi:hypothetical protein